MTDHSPSPIDESQRVSQPLWKRLTRFQKLSLLGLLLCFFLGVGILLIIPPQQLIEFIFRVLDGLLAWLQERPLWLLAAVAILPGFGAPTSPFVIACGAVGIPQFGLWPTILATLLAISLCMIWNYWVARSLFRGFFARFLASKEHLLPEGRSGNFLLFAILLRITPGVPLVIQNYFLGFLKMPFRKYLLVSIPAQAIHTPFYVISGGALVEGNFLVLLGALLVIVFLSGVTYLVRHRLEKSKSNPGSV